MPVTVNSNNSAKGLNETQSTESGTVNFHNLKNVQSHKHIQHANPHLSPYIILTHPSTFWPQCQCIPKPRIISLPTSVMTAEAVFLLQHTSRTYYWPSLLAWHRRLLLRRRLRLLLDRAPRLGLLCRWSTRWRTGRARATAGTWRSRRWTTARWRPRPASRWTPGPTANMHQH